MRGGLALIFVTMVVLAIVSPATMLIHVSASKFKTEKWWFYRIMLRSDNCLAGIRTFTLSVDSSRGVRLVMEGEVKDSISLAC